MLRGTSMQQISGLPRAKGILAGTGSVVAKLAALYERPFRPPLLGQIDFVAWVRDTDVLTLVDIDGKLGGVPEYPNCESAFEAYPDVDFVCDLTDGGSYMERFRALAPAKTALVSSSAVAEYCDAALRDEIPDNPLDSLKKSARLFNALLDQFEEEVVIVDTEGCILNLNSRMLESWGGAKNDYIGKCCTGLDKPELTCANSRPFFEMVLETGRKITETYTEVTADGRMHYFHVNAFPLRDEHGDIRRLALTRRDTTDQVQIEQRLYQSQKMAAIGELSTYIAHEIRNPLFAIGGFANALLRASSLDESAREKARIILAESQRLDEILKSIINFARPTEQALGDVDANAVVGQTVEIMGIGTEKDIPIVMELARNLPKVYGNAEMLKQCLINLIKNAQEAMNKGTIHVRTRYMDGTVYLEVEDDGPGIPPELQEQIFSPFFSTKDKGAGLGLAMTRKIINEIGGKLLLQSKVGKGTLISLALKPVLAVSENGKTFPLAGS